MRAPKPAYVLPLPAFHLRISFFIAEKRQLDS